MPDYERTVYDLEVLHKAASSLDGWDKHLAQEFIDVGEYCLALDSISYAYLLNNEKMSADLFAIFNRLAVEMDMERDPEYEGVAKLRAAAKAR